MTEEWREHFRATAAKLRGSERRKYKAEVAEQLGGQRAANRELGWNRRTISKGKRELENGVDCIDAFNARGVKRVEERLPRLLADIKAIVDAESQIDPTFQSERLYARISAREVRKQLIEGMGYTDEELPTVRTISSRLNELGYTLKKVQKSKPQKK